MTLNGYRSTHKTNQSSTESTFDACMALHLHLMKIFQLRHEEEDNPREQDKLKDKL
ncbi:hypothetical protein PROFUN_15819 [Planoprotostelium fungivorum]|uniref:Uncharacterized protein n=1 Tax=Planoprotostelium fungivorum TaxID=1890364 RepID=A0A2P6MU89_9EUKA|nr:hypothetical protein PROFUN_15819 [Planoprotostelium fungivorum]